MATKVAVVSGSNKGIGLAIVRELCRHFKGDVILTARDGKQGQESVSLLQKEGLDAKFHRMDLLDHSSIEDLKKRLLSEYGGLDILVNNAGIAFKGSSTASMSEQAEVTIATNYYGTLDVCNVLFPILRPHARVVNISSEVSVRGFRTCSEQIQRRLKDPDLTISRLSSMLEEFKQAAKDGNVAELGWPQNTYAVSKMGVTFFSFIQQKQFDHDPREDIVVNACCPGYVATDMSSYKGPLTVEEGAETPVYLALLPDGVSAPRGCFVREKKIQSL